MINQSFFNCHIVAKAEIDAGITEHSYQFTVGATAPSNLTDQHNKTPELHYWLSWEGYGSDGDVECNSPFAKGKIQSVSPKILGGEESIKLSPCKYDFALFHKCLTDASSKDKGTTGVNTKCHAYNNSLLEKCKNDSKTAGCTR